MINVNTSNKAVIRRNFLKCLGVAAAVAATGSASAFSYIFDAKDGNILTIAQCLIAGNIVNTGYQNIIKTSLNDIYAFMSYTSTYVEVQIAIKKEWLKNNPDTYEKISDVYQWDKNVTSLIGSLNQLRSRITASMSDAEKRHQRLA